MSAPESESSSITNLLRDILGGALVSFIGFVVTRFAGLGEKILIARFFDPSRYGQVVLAVSLLSVAVIVGSLGLQSGVVRYLPRYSAQETKQGIVGSSIKLTFVTSVLLAGAGLLTADWLATTVFEDPDLVSLFRIMAIAIPLAVFGELGAAIARGDKNARVTTFIEKFSFPITRILLVLLVIVLGFGTLGIAFAYVGGYAVMALISAGYVYAVFGMPLTSHFDYDRLLRFSFPLLFANSMSFVSSSLDTILIGIFLTSSAVGIYGAAYPLARLVFIPLGLMGLIFSPIISELHADDKFDEINEIYATVTKWIVILTLPGVALLMTEPNAFLGFIFGEEYAAGAVPLAILAFGFFVHSVLGINGGTLKMLGHSKFYLFSSVINAVVNVLLNIWLIPREGIVGAAVATAVSYAIGNALISIRLYSNHRVHPFQKQNFYAYGILISAFAVTYLPIRSRLGGILLILTVYGVTFCLFVVVYLLSNAPTEAERELLEEYRKKLL